MEAIAKGKSLQLGDNIRVRTRKLKMRVNGRVIVTNEPTIAQGSIISIKFEKDANGRVFWTGEAVCNVETLNPVTVGGSTTLNRIVEFTPQDVVI